MTLTSDKVLLKPVGLRNENSSGKKKPVGTSGEQKLIRPPFCASYQRKIAYEIFENSTSKYKLMDLIPRDPYQNNSKGVQKFVKEISKIVEKENPFRDSNLWRESKNLKKLPSNHDEAKIKQKSRISCARNYRTPTNKPDEVQDLPIQNITPIKIAKKSSAASNCSSITKPRRGAANQLPSNFVEDSDSARSVSVKTSVASQSNASGNSNESEPKRSKTRIKKVKRSEIPLRKILPNALNKKKPVSVSLLMEKSLVEVESDVSIDCYHSFTPVDNLSMITEWSNDEKSMKGIDNYSESENTLKSENFVEDAQLTRTLKTSNIPLNSRISSFEFSDKIAVKVCKSKKLDLEAVKSSISTANKTSSIIFQRLESLHQQTVTIKEKQNSSVISTELKEPGSKSSFSSVVSKKLKKTATQQKQRKNIEYCDKSCLKIKNKKTDKETRREKPNLPQKKGQADSKSKILPEKLLIKNERLLIVKKELKTSDSRSSAKSKQSFTVKEDSAKRKNNLKETENIKKTHENKSNKKLNLKSSNSFKKSDSDSANLNLTTIDGGSETLKTEKEEETSNLTFKEDMEESEQTDHLLQLLISQIPITPTSPNDYMKYREILSVVGEIRSNSTLPLDYFEIDPSSLTKEPKKLPQSRNKFSAKGKPKKIKSDKIDLQEEMEKLSQPSSNQMLTSKAKKPSKIEIEEKSDKDKDNEHSEADIMVEEALIDLPRDATMSEGELENLDSCSLSRLINNCSQFICDQEQRENESITTKETEEKIEKNFEESSNPENSDTVKKPSLADAAHENSSNHSNNLKLNFDNTKDHEKKKFFNPKGHFGSATTVKIKNKKQKPETKMRRNIVKPFDKVEKQFNDLFEQVVAVRLKRRNSEPSSFRDFVRKTTDTIVPKSDKTSVLSLCSSLRHLNTDELEDFRVWETVPTKMTSCWEVSLYHFRRPWSVLSCSVFKDNQRASTPGIILENLRNGGSLGARRSTASEKSKVITPKEASFDVEPSIAQKNMDIRNWLAALNFPPPPSISCDILAEVNNSLPVISSSQSKVNSLERRKIPRGIKFSEETLTAKFSKNPENSRKWGFDLPKSKELVRRKSGGYVAVSRDSENHIAFTKQAFVKTQSKPKKEKVVKNEIKITKCESVSCSQEKLQFPEKADCGIQVNESDFEGFSLNENIIRIKEAEVVENDYLSSVKEMRDNTADNFNIWKYLFFVSLSIIIYNFFSRNAISPTV